MDQEVSKPRYVLADFLGHFFVYLFFGIICALVIVPYLFAIELLVTAVESNFAWLFFCPVLMLCMFLYTMVLCVVVKWVLVGKMRPKYVDYGSFEYFRVWLFSLIQRTLFEFSASMFVGTFVLNFFYRMMGARIGNWVYLGSTCIDYPDMIEIDDYCTLSAHQVKLMGGHRRRNGIDFDRISIQEKASIGAQVTILRGSTVGRRSVVEPLTCVRPDSPVQDGLILQGVPARAAGQNSLAEGAFSYSGFGRSLVVAFWQVLTILLVSVSKSITIMLAIVVSLYIGFGSSVWEIGAWLTAIIVAYELLVSILAAVISRITLVGMWGKEVECDLYSMDFLRHELAKAVVRSSRMIIIVRSGLLGLCNYQLLGLKTRRPLAQAYVPPDSMITRPDLVEFKEFFFCGSLSRIDSEHVRNGRLALSKILFMEDTIIGNNSYVGGGRIEFNQKRIVGAMSCVLADRVHSGNMIIGSPAISLNGNAADDVSHPSLASLSFWLVIQTLLALVICAVIGLFYAALYKLCYLGYLSIDAWMLVALPFIIVLGAVSLLLISIVLKWILIGRYRTNKVHPVYGWYTARKLPLVMFEFSTGYLMVLFEGTGLLNLYYKLQGAKVAMSCKLFTTSLLETDTLSIGEDVFVGAGSVVQCHMFRQQGGFEFEEISIKDGVTIGTSCVVLPGAKLGEKCRIGDQSLVMQMEHLPPKTYWVGSPCELSKWRSAAVTSRDDVVVDVGCSMVEMSNKQELSKSAMSASLSESKSSFVEV
eukprot:TRINITY_DN17240_c0_g2_i1.p1 TRINITY_DN17240_c0_g2~~TRINITY_DN17240_c0_g2_i1.p1  ORF type:complete len:868 (+),score=196.29 TRINITY_DN17240_c0_g2_i1:333-2606(+)